MKRFTAILLCLALVLSMAAFAAGDPVDVEVASVEAEPGDEIVLTVSIPTAASFKAMSIEPVFDSSVLSVVSGVWGISGFMSADWSSSDPTAVIAFLDNTDIEGVFFTLTMKVDENTTADSATVDVSVTGKIKVDGGGEESVTFNITAGTVTIKQSYTGPDWTWATDYSSATATFTNENDTSVTVDVTATITSNNVPETCTEDGKIVYTATAEFQGKDYTDEKEEAGASKLGHDWAAPEYEWGEDFTCTAKKVCNRCGEEEVIEVAEVTSEVITEPSADGDGLIRYTATFTDASLETQTLDVTVPYEPEETIDYEGIYRQFLEAMVWSKNVTSKPAAKPADTTPKGDGWNNPFTDVSDKDAFYDAVRFVYERGLFYGMEDTKFGPNVTMTRGMFVAVLGRLAEVDTSKYSGSSYDDVDPTQYYAPYVEWANDNGIVYGYGNGKFGPNDLVTVEQAAAIIARYAKFIGVELNSDGKIDTFGDVASVSAWAKNTLAWAVSSGVYAGQNGALNAKANASRAVVATMLYNFVSKIVDKK